MLIKLGLIFLSLIATTDWKEEVKQIDQQIEQLEDLQDKYRSNARRNTNNAMRWQFQNENYLDARRAWDRASEDKQKIQEIQDQIDDLQLRKKKILKEYGDKQAS